MSLSSFPISFCCGVYNEEEVLTENIRKLKKGLNRLVGKGNYEIILVENGSTDNTPILLKRINDKNIKVLFSSAKGLGLAFKIAVMEAKYDHVVFSAIDLLFGFSDLKMALSIWSDYDIIFGSKAHPKSEYKTNLNRKLASYVYRFLLSSLFNIKIKDSQGSLFLVKSKILPILNLITSENAFFSAQLAIHGGAHNLRMREIPVKMAKYNDLRKSKFNVIKDGLDMLISMLKEYIRFKRSY